MIIDTHEFDGELDRLKESISNSLDEIHMRSGDSEIVEKHISIIEKELERLEEIHLKMLTIGVFELGEFEVPDDDLPGDLKKAGEVRENE